MPNYQFRFMPVDTFFFGGEKHDEKLIANYFVESNLYPQQTAILGFLRFYLLTKSTELFRNNKIVDPAAAANLIGDASFDYTQPGADFKKISQVSPLYLCRQQVEKYQCFHFAPLDASFEMVDNFKLEKDKIPFKAKEHGALIELKLHDGNETIPLAKIIIPVSRIGNEKGDNGAAKEDAFYKMTAMRMAEGWSFAIDAEIDINGLEGETFLPFGAEKSYFRIMVSAQPKTASLPLQNYKRSIPMIECNSDCFVESEVLKRVNYGITRFVSFRNIKSRIIGSADGKVEPTTDYSGLSPDQDGKLKRSNRYNLLQRGSVLYFEQETERDAVFKVIDQKAHCKKIGFNHITKN